MSTKKLIRVLTFIIFILTLLMVLQIRAHAQESPLLKKKITIHLQQEPLKKALDKITAVSGIGFTYNGAVAYSTIKIDLDVKNKPLDEALSEAFKGKAIQFSLLQKEVFIRLGSGKAKEEEAGPAANLGKGNARYVVSGMVKVKETGEALTGVTLSVSGTNQGVATNEYGFFSLMLPAGSYILNIKRIGLKPFKTSIDLSKNERLDLSLEEEPALLDTVRVSRGPARKMDDPQMGTERLNIKDINGIPVLMGERDVVKNLQMLPGIKSPTEGGSGFFVRGGAADQNLILLDEAPIYNATHLLGFFSAFNSDALKDVTLYKSGMPARYGGSLSSVLDVRMNDGNNQKLKVGGGIGLTAARVSIEGPIQKEKSSFLISARRTYADQLLKLAGDTQIKNSTLYFYDVNLKANYLLGEGDRLFISGYFGRDVFKAKDISALDWGNVASTVRWNHIFGPKLFSNTSLIYSNYSYKVKSGDHLSSYTIYSRIRDWSFKEDLQWYANEYNTISFGINTTYHNIKPGELQVSGNLGLIPQKFQERFSLDNALYVSNTWRAAPVFGLTYGLRISAFSLLGPGDYYHLDQDGEVTDTDSYAAGQWVKTYFNAEPRISAAFYLGATGALKISYTRNSQNLHLISNSSGSDPKDRWLASTNIIKPEKSDQYSVGYYRDMAQNTYELTAELYYKKLWNQIDYKNGADVFTSRPIESQLLFGIGRAFGVELLFKKKTGRLTGWISYTLSKTERKIDGINENLWYNASQDKTHQLNLVGIYQLNPKWSLSACFVFSTGNAVTFPNTKYKILGYNYYYFAGRNRDRLPDSHRLDIGATRVLRKTEKFSSELNFSIYNVYGQRNPYRVIFRDRPSDADVTEARSLSLFRFVPSVSYNFKF